MITMTKTQVTNLSKEVAIKNVLAGVATDKYYNYKALTYVSAIECIRNAVYDPEYGYSTEIKYYEVDAKYRGRKVHLKISVYENSKGKNVYVWWGKYSSPVKNLPGMKDWSFDFETLIG